MNPEVVGEVVRMLLFGVGGYVLGAVTQYRVLKVRGRSILVPYVPDKGRRVSAVLLVLALVTTGTVVLGYAERQRVLRCEAEFMTALADQTDLNREGGLLEARYRELNSIRYDATDELVTALAEAGEDGRYDTEEVRLALAEYRGVVERETEERDRLNERRDQLAAERRDNPVPEPKCGR